MVFPLTDNYPLAISDIVNKPILCYQLEYLQRYGIHDIMITVSKLYAHRLEKYLKNHYKTLDRQTNVELVVFSKNEEQIVAL